MGKKLSNKKNKKGDLSPKAFVIIVALAFIAIAAIVAVPIIVHNLTYEPQLDPNRPPYGRMRPRKRVRANLNQQH